MTLQIDRAGRETYVARNERGAEVHLGGPGAEGSFEPGELLGLALAACGLLSADFTLSRRLGEDFAATTEVTTTKSSDQTRYAQIDAVIGVDLGSLAPDAATTLVERAERAVARLCTIGHTLDQPPAHTVSVRHTDDPPRPAAPVN